MWSLFKKKTPVRRILNGETVALTVKRILKQSITDGFKLYLFKGKQAVITRGDVDEASLAAYRVWEADKWECEDQARALVHELQTRASKETCSYAVGVARGFPPKVPGVFQDGTKLHMYVWVVVESPTSLGPVLDVMLYDATARREVNLKEVSGLDFACS